MSENPYKIGITQGDYYGKNYESILKALSDNKMTEFCVPIVYGLSKVSAYYKKHFEIQDFSLQLISKIEQVNLKKNNLLNLSEQDFRMEEAQPEELVTKMAELSLQTACKDLKSNQIDAIVTAPVSAAKLGKYNGQTEWIAAQANVQSALLMMVADNLRMAFVSSHLPLQQVVQAATTDIIVKKIKMLHKSLLVDFRCANPTIAVLSMQAKEEKGELQKADWEVLRTAVNQVFDEKINAFGPFSMENFFREENYARYDAVLAMCPEQGLEQFQLIANGDGACYTAGLPFVHTSLVPSQSSEHAPTAMRNAIYTAVDILRNRKTHAEYAKK